jgi:hypothetical protein
MPNRLWRLGFAAVVKIQVTDRALRFSFCCGLANSLGIFGFSLSGCRQVEVLPH